MKSVYRQSLRRNCEIDLIPSDNMCSSIYHLIQKYSNIL